MDLRNSNPRNCRTLRSAPAASETSAVRTPGGRRPRDARYSAAPPRRIRTQCPYRCKRRRTSNPYHRIFQRKSDLEIEDARFRFGHNRATAGTSRWEVQSGAVCKLCIATPESCAGATGSTWMRKAVRVNGSNTERSLNQRTKG